MKSKKVITKIAVLLVWLAVGIGMTVLLVAANRKQGERVCKGVSINIKGKGEKFFIEKEDILKSLYAGASESLINQPLTKIDLAKLEKEMEKHRWIQDAELYFDSRNVLHIAVRESEPIARIFTAAGTSFYIDEEGRRLPLLQKVSIRLPVVTNFTAAKKLNKRDSALLKSVTALVQHISADAFWNAQIAQIDVTASGELEAMPVVGNHVIRLGKDNFDEKLNRLLIFYKQVLSKAGFDKYAAVDVRFDGQVIGVRKGSASAVDSIQLQKNIRELMERSRLRAVEDSTAAAERMNAQLRRDTTLKKLMETLMQQGDEKIKIDTGFIKKLTAKPQINTIKSSPVKTKVRSKPTENAKPKTTKKTSSQKPKAVMPQRANDY